MYQTNLPLTLQDAQPALAEGLRAIEAGQTEFDLSRVESLDSAAVAIMLTWQRTAQSRGAQVAFRNLPPSLHSLAKLYGVAELLHLELAAAPSGNTQPH